MIHNFRRFLLFFLGIFVLNGTLNAVVDDITGDVGTAQSGSLGVSGGTSGLIFDSTTSTIVSSINFISMPLTTASNGQILISGEPVFHNFGAGNQNIFVGGSAGNFTLTGAENTACGNSALNSITAGSQNTAIGDSSLINLTSGNDNTGVGEFTLGSLISGSNNVAIGANAGDGYTNDESNNIIIGSANSGTAGENNTIRIGGGDQTDCYIDGIFESTVDVDTASQVFVDFQGKLGTIASSDKYKMNVKDIKDSSDILQLRPVSFNFKDGKSKKLQYGLIAEEVNKVFPNLVIKTNGHPNAVRYDELPVLLLNELIKMDARIKKLEAALNKQ